jgi:hypothetical protein
MTSLRAVSANTLASNGFFTNSFLGATLSRSVKLNSEASRWSSGGPAEERRQESLRVERDRRHRSNVQFTRAKRKRRTMPFVTGMGHHAVRSLLAVSCLSPNHTRGLCGIGEARNGMLRRSATYSSRTPTVAQSRRASYCLSLRWSTAASMRRSASVAIGDAPEKILHTT